VVVFLAEKHALNALVMTNGRRVEHPVSSGRGASEGAERVDTGRGTPACPVHFWVVADAGDRTQCVSVRCK
jgi:hypothetical protein